MPTFLPTSKIARSPLIAEMLYGPDYTQIREGQIPTPSDVSEWLREQRKSWPSRTLSRATTINEVTTWAREQKLKRLDWDFIPKKTIWFRDPQVAMIWDLTCSQKTTEKTVDQEPKT
jgi:hypothetical protein